MYKKITAIIISLLAAAILSLTAYASAAVSPALRIIENSMTMKKSGPVLENIRFSAKDFDNACGVERVDSLTIRSLPDAVSGKLVLNGKAIAKGQVITRPDLGKICFRSYSGDCVETSFDFTARYNGGNSEVRCMIYTLSEDNAAPVALIGRYYQDPLITYENVPIYSTMPAEDPDGDAIEFKVVRFPDNGVLTVTNTRAGNFRYTPNKDFTGSDSFEYTVSDKYGNTSGNMKINISVEKRVKNTVFSDMSGHWAQYASLRLTDDGIMSYYETNGKYDFRPDEAVTRAQFVRSAMAAFGYGEEITGGSSFDDFGQVPSSCAGYVAAAEKAGIIAGSTDGDGRTVFRPNDAITRAEASVIICRLTDTGYISAKQVFSDMTGATEWSESAIYTLKEEGLICGTGDGCVSPEKILTRAEAAQILVKAAN